MEHPADESCASYQREASFQVNIDNKGSRAIYDSRFPSRHRSLRTLPFELALGQRIHYGVDGAGKLVRFKGVQDAIMKRLATRTGELRFTPEITEQSLRTSILEQFGDAALREAFADGTITIKGSSRSDTLQKPPVKAPAATVSRHGESPCPFSILAR